MGSFFIYFLYLHCAKNKYQEMFAIFTNQALDILGCMKEICARVSQGFSFNHSKKVHPVPQ